MLTTAAEAIDRVIGLEVGADDYVPKPFDLRELLARVRALMRRLNDSAQDSDSGPQAHTGKKVRFGHCILDLESHRLLGRDGDEIAITAAEFDLLSLFARNPNKPLNRDQIMERAHNKGWEVFDRSIDLRIMRLRRKIEVNPNKPEVLKTVRGVGYIYATGENQ
jgi:two-component system phosphate regulon response regulator OmpR